MKLSELLSHKYINKKARLLSDITLDSGEARGKGEIVMIAVENSQGRFYAEGDNFTSCVLRDEFEYI